MQFVDEEGPIFANHRPRFVSQFDAGAKALIFSAL
jgi:hypothetical protein